MHNSNLSFKHKNKALVNLFHIKKNRFVPQIMTKNKNLPHYYYKSPIEDFKLNILREFDS